MKKIKQGSIMNLIPNIIILIVAIIWLNNSNYNLEIIGDGIVIAVECLIVITLNILFLLKKIPRRYCNLYGQITMALTIITSIILIILTNSNMACIYILLLIFEAISLVGSIKIIANSKETKKDEIKEDNK